MNGNTRGLVQCGCHCPAGGTARQVVYHCSMEVGMSVGISVALIKRHQYSCYISNFHFRLKPLKNKAFSGVLQRKYKSPKCSRVTIKFQSASEI